MADALSETQIQIDAAAPAASTARQAPAFEFDIERGKAREFAAATDSRLIEDGRGRLYAPLTFLAASALWMRPENSAWFGVERDFRRILHGEQHFEYIAGVPHVGKRFTARQRIGETYEKSGRRGVMQFTEVVTDFWTTSEATPDARMTAVSILMPEAAPAPEPSSERPPAARTTAPAGSVLGRSVRPAYTVTDFVKYQGASGDFNPIHHDTEFARRAGFDGPFAVGMLTAGIAAGKVAELRGLHELRSFSARWKSQAWPGDQLEYVVSPPDGTGRIDVEVSRGPGDVHMQAWATFEG